MLESTNTNYLESISDEEIFAPRYQIAEADAEELYRNSVLVDGRRFYRANKRREILRKYAENTNPKPGEPGSKENPLVRFGKEYVYNEIGDLVEYVHHTVRYVLRQDMKPTNAQKKMILRASSRPISYTPDCPELSEEALARLAQYGKRREERRRETVFNE